MMPGDVVPSAYTAIDDGWPITLLGISAPDNVLRAISAENGLVAVVSGAVSLVHPLAGYPLIANTSNAWTSVELVNGSIMSDPGLETATVEEGNYLKCSLDSMAEGMPLHLKAKSQLSPFEGHTGISYRATFTYNEIPSGATTVVTGTILASSPTLSLTLSATVGSPFPGSDGTAEMTIVLTVPTSPTYNYYTGTVPITYTLTKMGTAAYLASIDNRPLVVDDPGLTINLDASYFSLFGWDSSTIAVEASIQFETLGFVG